MTTGRENTWTMPTFNAEMSTLIESYKKYPPRPMQSEFYQGEMTIDRFRMIEKLTPELKKLGVEGPSR
jgi:arylsulfatase